LVKNINGDMTGKLRIEMMEASTRKKKGMLSKIDCLLDITV